MYYSASTQGFYDEAFHGTIPSDAVEITADEYTALLAGQSVGKRIVPDAEGKPVLADPPAPTAAELAVQRRATIVVELTAIDVASARPLRAILAAQAAGRTAAAADLAKLADLESQAVTLRKELSTII